MGLMEISKDPKVNVIIQEFISASKGRDVRVIMLGGRPLGAMLRVAKEGMVKTNFAQGGDVSSYPLNPALEWLATEASNMIGLEIAGVDLLIADGHYVICEVNSTPGFEGFEKATGVNVPKAIFEYIAVRLGMHPKKNISVL